MWIPHEKLFTIPANNACITTVVLDDGVAEDAIASVGMTEWMDDIYIQVIRTDKVDATGNPVVLNDSNSALFSSGSYYYSRETDDGDFAGRIPMEKKEALHLVMINYSDEDVQSLKLQYGGAL